MNQFVEWCFDQCSYLESVQTGHPVTPYFSHLLIQVEDRSLRSAMVGKITVTSGPLLVQLRIPSQTTSAKAVMEDSPDPSRPMTALLNRLTRGLRHTHPFILAASHIKLGSKTSEAIIVRMTTARNAGVPIPAWNLAN